MEKMITLQEEPTVLKRQNLSKLPEHVGKIVLYDLQQLSDSGIIENVPKVGDKLKDFILKDYFGKEQSLASLRQKGPVVLSKL